MVYHTTRCNKRGHLAYNCPDKTPPPADRVPLPKGEMGEAKRSTLDNPERENKPSTRARTAAIERGNQPSTRGSGRGGESANGYNGGGRGSYGKSKVGSHTTQGAVCNHCHNENHVEAQCWKLHPELNPYAARVGNANMLRLVEEDVDNNRR